MESHKNYVMWIAGIIFVMLILISIGFDIFITKANTTITCEQNLTSSHSNQENNTLKIYLKNSIGNRNSSCK